MSTSHSSFDDGRARPFGAGCLSASLLLMLAAGEAAGQGFAGKWESTLGTGPAAEVRASVMFNLDGSGAVPVIGTGFTPRVLAKRGTEWVPVGAPFAMGHINALVAFDPDGDGPLPAQLIAAGDFTFVGTSTPNLVENVNRVARWDGTAWVPMGQGVSDVVFALAVYDPDGPGPQPPQLIAGGKFLGRPLSAGVLNGVARWDGTAWQPLGSGVSAASVPGEVHALTVFDADGDGPLPPKLIAGGTFSAAGGAPANNIAAWDGSSWSALGGGVGGGTPTTGAGIVSALFVDDPDGNGPQPARLIAGGAFTTAAGASAGGIAQWDGGAWLPLGNDNLASVLALARFDPDGDGPIASRIVAGKDGGTASPGAAGCVVAWDGSAWQPLGGGLDVGLPSKSVKTLLVDSVSAGAGRSRLIAGGTFKTAGAVRAPNVAQWDGASWQRIASERSGQTLADAVVLDAGGLAPQQLVTLSANLLAWNGSSWQDVASDFEPGFWPQTLGVSLADATNSPRGLLVGGTVFEEDAGMIGLSYQLAPSGWQSIGSPSVGFSDAIVFDADGAGPGPSQLVVTDRTAVYRWNGTVWQRLGERAFGGTQINALAVFDPDGAGPQAPQLIAAGSFTSIGSVPLNHIARWGGFSWEPLGAGLLGNVVTLATFDPDGDGPQPPRLIAGGPLAVTPATNDHPAARLAQWDGSNWSEFAGGANGTVSSLVVDDPDGDGPRPRELYASGAFTAVGGVSAPNVARWDGAHWHPVGDGTDRVNSLLLYTPPGELHPRLVALGPTVAGPWAVPSIAVLSARRSPADVGSAGGETGPDGALDNNDFISFINLFFAGDANADIGRAGGLPGADGAFDNNDFIAFISFFFAG